jgi:predicted secreted Zn-dependent protease
MSTTYSENWVYYDVSGATLADVAASISHLPEAGRCEWHPTYTYTTDEHGKVDSFTVDCPYTITMPNWTDKYSASPEAQAEWDRWYEALERHERGHVEATAWIFDNMDDPDVGVIGMTPADAQGQFGKFVYDAQQASDRYDDETNHGLNDGTVMDTSIA